MQSSNETHKVSQLEYCLWNYKRYYLHFFLIVSFARKIYSYLIAVLEVEYNLKYWLVQYYPQ